MANVNTIQDQISGSFYPTIAPLVNPIATAAFVQQTNPVVASLGGLPAVVSLVPAASQGGQGSIWDNGKPFKVRASGRVTGGTTTNLTLSLYQVPSAILAAGTHGTIANDVLVSATAALAVNSVSSTFLIEALLQWDSVSGKLNGTFRRTVNGSFAEIAIAAPVSISADTELNFIMAGLFSATSPGNLLVLSEFSIEQV